MAFLHFVLFVVQNGCSGLCYNSFVLFSECILAQKSFFYFRHKNILKIICIFAIPLFKKVYVVLRIVSKTIMKNKDNSEILSSAFCFQAKLGITEQLLVTKNKSAHKNCSFDIFY